MEAKAVFWMIFILAILVGGYLGRENIRGWLGDRLLIFILIFLLGWKVFGFIIQ